jgi:hypothetical protein
MKREFKSNGFIITREDYESMPCAMYAMEFTDKQMQTLVENIACVMGACYGYTEYEISCLERGTQEWEDFEDTFWREMEWCAVNMGMRYYEDMTDEEYSQITTRTP